MADCAERTVYHTNPYEADSDHDGLNDGIEVLRLGMDPNSADSDSDGISDWAEAMGFQDVNGKWWYLDPLNADTNNDGQIDSDECPSRKDIR